MRKIGTMKKRYTRSLVGAGLFAALIMCFVAFGGSTSKAENAAVDQASVAAVQADVPAADPAEAVPADTAVPAMDNHGSAVPVQAPAVPAETARKNISTAEKFERLWNATGLNAFVSGISEAFNGDSGKQSAEVDSVKKNLLPVGLGQLIMIVISCILIYLAIAKGFEPLLLIPIGFGGILANIPVANIAGPEGFLGLVYGFGIKTGLFPLLIFMGVGAMTDFGPLIANPKTALLGGAAQLGIFATLIGALWITELFPFIDFSLKDAASIGIIGGADGPTAIFLAGKLSPDLLGAIAVAAYSYMALVPIIQPPIMRFLTTEEERKIEMRQLRHVKKIEKIIFPLLVLGLCILLLPDATPLLGVLMFGNLIKESGVAERLSKTAANELINIVTILLGLSVGSKLAADQFLRAETLGILILGLIAFSVGTGGGVLLGKLMNVFSKDKINPLIGAAGVSAVPMAARVANNVGLENNPHNYLLMHAMGPNVSGVIGSAVAAGVLLALCG